jgi:hypothetical protein
MMLGLVLCLAGSAWAQLLSIHHHVRGTLGTISPGWLTVLQSDNSVVQIYIGGNYHPPSGLVAGKTVVAAYVDNAQGQHMLVHIKEARGGNASAPNTNPSGIVTPVL